MDTSVDQGIGHYIRVVLIGTLVALVTSVFIGRPFLEAAILSVCLGIAAATGKYLVNHG